MIRAAVLVLTVLACLTLIVIGFAVVLTVLAIVGIVRLGRLVFAHHNPEP